MPQWRTVLAIAAVIAMSGVAAAAIVVALDRAEGLSPATAAEDRARGIREDLEAAERQLEAARTELKEARRQLAEERRRAAAFRRLSKELALAGGTQTCSPPGTTQVTVQIVEPEDGSAVSSPVMVHLLVTEPLGCEATYYLSVDGVPYAPQEDDGGRGTPARPFSYAPLGQGSPTDACVSSVYSYVAVDLDPGGHTVQVNGGCPGGPAVPDTIPTSVSFEVSESG